jgi:hypothetical protein
LNKPFKIPSKRKAVEDAILTSNKKIQSSTDSDLPNIQVNASGNNIKVDIHITIKKLDG